MSWKEKLNMENFECVESIQAAWSSLLTEAIQRKHYLATKALLRLCKVIYRQSEPPSTAILQTESDFEGNNKSASQRNKSVELNGGSNRFAYFGVLAVQTNNVKFMRLMMTNNMDIESPHMLDCKCWLCENDKLGQSKRRIETLNALSNPIWISLNNDDPFLHCFQLIRNCRMFRSHQDCYEKEYDKIIKQNVMICTGLLDHIKNEEEVKCLMRWQHENFRPFSKIKDLSFLRLGIKFHIKEVVAHAVPQHVIMSIVSDGIPRWKSGGILYRISFILLVAICYPFTALISIFSPASYIGQMASKPLIRFINGVASFITLLFMLAFMANYPKTGLRTGDKPAVIEVIIFVWIFSLFVQEIKQLTNEGKRQYFGSGWNWIDINMIFLVVIAYIMWIILYFIDPRHQKEELKFFISLPDGFFALAIILSFFRMVCLCQITRFLGLLQLCLGRMLQVLFQFAFISIVILCSFSVGLVFLFHSSTKYQKNSTEMSLKNANGSYIDQMLSGSYNGLPATIVTLSWASMNMIGLDSLDGLKDGTMIHLWSFLLFTLYHGISMIVLLNMLIAMMSNSYQQIENNIDIEHKYARTNLWLEYLGDNNTVPCPFNLLPTVSTIRSLLRKIGLIIKNEPNGRKSSEARYASEQKEEYKKLCKHLMQRYLRKMYNISLDDDTLHSRHVTTDEINDDDPFFSMVKEKVKIWSREFNQTHSRTDCFNNNGSPNNGVFPHVDGII